MAVLHALRRSPGALLSNPVLFVPMLLLMLTQLPSLALQSVDPLLSSLFSLAITGVYVLLLPFFQGGMIAMATEALDGRTSLGTFVAAGKRHYVSLLVAYLLLLVVYFALGIVAFVAGVAGVASILGSGGLESASLVVLVLVGGFVALLVLAYLVAVFFLQFYGQAIVIEDLGAIDGLTRSVRVVREHLLATLGYTLLVGVLSLLMGGTVAVGSFVLAPDPTGFGMTPQPTPELALAFGLAITVFGTLFGAFFLVFSVAFYRRVAT